MLHGGKKILKQLVEEKNYVMLQEMTQEYYTLVVLANVCAWVLKENVMHKHYTCVLLIAVDVLFVYMPWMYTLM